MNDTVKKIVADILEVELESVTEDASILDDLGADSIAVMEIVMELEEELDVEVPTDDILELKTVGDIIEYISKNA